MVSYEYIREGNKHILSTDKGYLYFPDKKQALNYMKEDNSYDVKLIDDGTLDTVVSVNGKEIRYDQEFASQFRKKDGSISDKGWRELKKQAIVDYNDSEDVFDVANRKASEKEKRESEMPYFVYNSTGQKQFFKTKSEADKFRKKISERMAIDLKLYSRRVPSRRRASQRHSRSSSRTSSGSL